MGVGACQQSVRTIVMTRKFGLLGLLERPEEEGDSVGNDHSSSRCIGSSIAVARTGCLFHCADNLQTQCMGSSSTVIQSWKSLRK